MARKREKWRLIDTKIETKGKTYTSQFLLFRLASKAVPSSSAC